MSYGSGNVGGSGYRKLGEQRADHTLVPMAPNTGATSALPSLKPTSSSSTPALKNKSDTKLLPQRTTKLSQKLAVFPGADALAEHSSAIADTKEVERPSLPRILRNIVPDFLMSKEGRKWLPRVTAYCTAGSYRMDELSMYLDTIQEQNRTKSERFDEAIYTPYTPMSFDSNPSGADLLGLGNHSSQDDEYLKYKPKDSSQTEQKTDLFFEQNVDHEGSTLPPYIAYNNLAKAISPFGECFFFDYGVVVFWGLTEQEEKTVLRNLRKFEDEKLCI